MAWDRIVRTSSSIGRRCGRLSGRPYISRSRSRIRRTRARVGRFQSARLTFTRSRQVQPWAPQCAQAALPAAGRRGQDLGDPAEVPVDPGESGGECAHESVAGTERADHFCPGRSEFGFGGTGSPDRALAVGDHDQTRAEGREGAGGVERVLLAGDQGRLEPVALEYRRVAGQFAAEIGRHGFFVPAVRAVVRVEQDGHPVFVGGFDRLPGHFTLDRPDHRVRADDHRGRCGHGRFEEFTGSEGGRGDVLAIDLESGFAGGVEEHDAERGVGAGHFGDPVGPHALGLEFGRQPRAPAVVTDPAEQGGRGTAPADRDGDVRERAAGVRNEASRALTGSQVALADEVDDCLPHAHDRLW